MGDCAVCFARVGKRDPESVYSRGSIITLGGHVELAEITARTKRAVRQWAGLNDSDPVVLDTKLESLRPGASNALLVNVNAVFVGRAGFPIAVGDWTALAPKTVRAVRDHCKKKLEQ
jgi:hypothetical protein